MKALELKRRFVQTGSMGDTAFKEHVWVLKRAGLMLWCPTTHAQLLLAEYTEKLISFQRQVINLQKQRNYLLSHIGNADQMPIYFDMPSNVIVDDKDTKSVPIKTTGNEKA